MQNAECRMQNAECRNDTTLGTAKNEHQSVSAQLSADSAKRRQTTRVSCDAGGKFYGDN